MLIIAVVLAVVGLASLVAAVATSNEVFAWMCIASSALGVILLAADAIRERKQRRIAVGALIAADLGADEIASAETEIIEAYSDTDSDSDSDSESEPGPDGAEDAPEEIVHDEPETDMPSDDEPDYPVPAEEAAMHIVTEDAELTEDAEQGTARVDEPGER